MPVTVYKILTWFFIFIRFCILHTVFFGKSFDLTMSEHWKTWHCYHQGADTKVFIAITELGNCSFFIRIVHKVYISLENLRVKINCIFDSITIFLIFFFFEHVHESRIVNTMHSKSSNKISFHHPESFGKQKCIRTLFCNTVYHFTPKFIWNCIVELRSCHCIF